MRSVSVKSKIISLLVVLVLLLCAAFFFAAPEQKADAMGAGGGGTIFGGFNYFTMTCTCSSGNSMIFLGPPSPGLYLYTPGTTRQYDYHSLPRMGVWVLGKYQQDSAVCSIYVGESCVDITTKGTIKEAGTSR